MFVEHLCMCLLAICVLSLKKMSLSILCPFLIGLFFCHYFVKVLYTYILDPRPLSDMWLHILSFILWVVILLSWWGPLKYKHVSFWWGPMYLVFSFVTCVLESYVRNHCLLRLWTLDVMRWDFGEPGEGVTCGKTWPIKGQWVDCGRLPCS